MKTIPLSIFNYQKEAIARLRTGSILCGGVGSGKSLTAIAYFFEKEYPKNLYIITTAAKRDTGDWEEEYKKFNLSEVVVDSWNNIKKYIDVKNSFFIFDEQRVIGSGSWVKSFLKITKNNNWILLSATPGDTWIDYIPVFIANGFYKNRSEFILEHVVYDSFRKFPRINRYVGESKLIRLKQKVLVYMDYLKTTVRHVENVFADYDKEVYDLVSKKRWNPYKNSPIINVSELFFTMRKVVNSDPSRMNIIRDLLTKHKKIIIFYNFNYELEILRSLEKDTFVAEYNGHKHDPIPEESEWVYLVQYTAGAEGWNCIETNTIIFYSLNYSYRVMTQSSGRIDRLNTPFVNLYYYRIRSKSEIDSAIHAALKHKKDFNENNFLKGEKL